MGRLDDDGLDYQFAADRAVKTDKDGLSHRREKCWCRGLKAKLFESFGASHQ